MLADSLDKAMTKCKAGVLLPVEEYTLYGDCIKVVFASLLLLFVFFFVVVVSCI